MRIMKKHRVCVMKSTRGQLNNPPILFSSF
jgi:hypothetical protein